MLRIKQLRTEKGLSQRALAFKIGANPKTVNFWERGICEPTAGFVAALADVFECTADYVLGREDDMGAINVLRGLSEGEKRILELYSKLSAKRRGELETYGRFLLTLN